MNLRKKLEETVERCGMNQQLTSDESMAVSYFAFMVVCAEQTAGNDEVFRQMVRDSLRQMADTLKVPLVAEAEASPMGAMMGEAVTKMVIEQHHIDFAFRVVCQLSGLPLDTKELIVGKPNSGVSSTLVTKDKEGD